MELPDRMIHQSFRYCLGRMSYVVSDWCDWFVANHESIPESEMAIIRKELPEAFQKDNASRECGWDWKRLGMDCDRRQWERVLKLIGDGDVSTAP